MTLKIKQIKFENFNKATSIRVTSMFLTDLGKNLVCNIPYVLVGQQDITLLLNMSGDF